MIKNGTNSPIWKQVEPLVKEIENLGERLNNMKIEDKGEQSPDEKIKG